MADAARLLAGESGYEPSSSGTRWSRLVNHRLPQASRHRKVIQEAADRRRLVTSSFSAIGQVPQGKALSCLTLAEHRRRQDAGTDSVGAVNFHGLAKIQQRGDPDLHPTIG
jgi:hypothetical protein